MINPPFEGSSDRSTIPEADAWKRYRLTPAELVQVCMGKKFELGSGKMVNETYEAWLLNLHFLTKAGHICPEMKRGFLDLNYYKRKDGDEKADAEDEAKRNHYHLISCYWPPIVT